MLDFELAEIYGYETNRFNKQVKNNIEKFDDDFRFQLTKEEWENLRSKISTSKSETDSGGRRYLPYVFSEAEIYMLMTVLKGALAVKQSKALIRTFKQMKDYIVENQGLIGQSELSDLILHLSNPQLKYGFLLLNGQLVEANLAYKGIIIDWNTEHQRIYNCGASSKDAGQRITSIMEVVDQIFE